MEILLYTGSIELGNNELRYHVTPSAPDYTKFSDEPDLILHAF